MFVPLCFWISNRFIKKGTWKKVYAIPTFSLSTSIGTVNSNENELTSKLNLQNLASTPLFAYCLLAEDRDATYGEILGINKYHLASTEARRKLFGQWMLWYLIEVDQTQYETFQQMTKAGYITYVNDNKFNILREMLKINGNHLVSNVDSYKKAMLMINTNC